MIWTELHKKALANTKMLKIQRQFLGILTLIALAIVLYRYFKIDVDLYTTLLLAGVVIIVATLFYFLPKLLQPLLYIWLLFGLLLGEITSTLILGLVFYILFFPITFILRKIRSKNAAEEEGWFSRKDDVIDYEKLY